MCSETMLFCVACINSTICTDCSTPKFLKADRSACIDNCTDEDPNTCSDISSNLNSYKCWTSTINNCIVCNGGVNSCN